MSKELNITDLPYNFTEHAKHLIQQRNSRAIWIQQTLSSPHRVVSDAEDPELKHALAEIPEFGNRVLRVIYHQESQAIKIISVYFDRTMRGKL